MNLRRISEAEAVVTADLLAGTSGPWSRGAEASIPRRTRQAIRQRLIAREVIVERLVPDPDAIGRPFVVFVIQQPFAESRARVISKWLDEEPAVEIWAFNGTLFGTFFLRGTSEVSALSDRLGGSGESQGLFLLACNSKMPSVPAYFDFEAEWIHVTGVHGVQTYPRHLPCSLRNRPAESTAYSPRDTALIQSLMRDQITDPCGVTSTSVGSQGHSHASVRRLLKKGMVDFRAFLNPAECFHWVSDFPDRIAFVRGELVAESKPHDLFSALVEDHGVYPFLYATDGTTVLFANLSRTSAPSQGPPQLDHAPPLVHALERYLRRIVVVREPLAELRVLRNHEYRFA